MKKLCLYTLIILCTISIRANIVMNKPITITQPDSSSYSAFVSGDEYYHRIHDEEDYTILRNRQTGYAVYAVQDGNRLRASDYIVGKVKPASLGIMPKLMDQDPARDTRFQEQQRLRRDGNRAVPIGALNNIMVYVRFADQAEYVNLSGTWYDFLFNSTNSRSLRNFYEIQSNGHLNITTHIYPGSDSNGFVVSIQIPQNRGFFSPYDPINNIEGYGDENTKNQRMLLLSMELTILTAPYIPANLNIDNDNDGVVDALTFLFKGDMDEWGDILWPAHLTYNQSVGAINGKSVTHYVLNFEMASSLSTICHEMGHMIGAPDYYHYSSAYMGSHEPWASISPVGGWDLMSNDNAQFWSVHTKWKYGGWFSNIPVLTPTDHPVTYTLDAIDESPYSCYKVESAYPNQYYLLEYRRQAGDYEIGLPGEGLLVWRVISNVNGNAQGPPDELYVYRPGGLVNTNGILNEAAFDLGSGRTQIHNYSDPKPWLYADSLSTNNGNLVITDIGAAGGSTITFTLRSTIPKYWSGSVSSDWSSNSNWKNGVPGANDDAIIPTQCTHYPLVNTSGSCRTLNISDGALLYIGTGSLTVHDDMINNGYLFMTEDGGSLTVLGSLLQESTSRTTINANVMLYIQGNLECRSLVNFSMQQGTLEFIGGFSSSIIALRPVILHNLMNDKIGGTLYFSLASTTDLVVNGNFTNLAGCTFRFDAIRNMILKGNYANYGNTVWNSNATLVLDGYSDQLIRDNDLTSYLGNLELSMSNPSRMATLLTSLRIQGDVHIMTGTLVLNGHDLVLHGDWKRETGSTGFVPGSNSVSFSGSEDQTCFGDLFYTIKLDKSDGNLIYPQNSSTVCAYYDWVQGDYSVEGGSFTVNDLTDNGVYGNISLSSGTITYYQDVSSRIDIHGEITIHAGTFTIHGGISPCYLNYSGSASINMDGGILDITDAGIGISNVMPVNENINGGRIRTSRGVEILRDDFSPVGSTFELYGSADCTISIAEGSSLYHLDINKSIPSQAIDTMFGLSSGNIATKIELNRNGGVTALGTLQLNGNLHLQSGRFTAPSIMKVKGNWVDDSSTFIPGNGWVEFNGLFDQACNTEAFQNLVINKPTGNFVISAFSNVTCQTYFCYSGTIEVVSGSFTADDLGQNGIYGNFIANSGCIIDLTQDDTHSIDLNGYITNHLGGISIHGGSGDSRWGFNSTAGISMDGGFIHFLDQGVQIEDWGHTFGFDVTDGTIQVNGGFTDTTGWVQFNGGTLNMVGQDDVTLSLGLGSYLWHLNINKAAINAEAEAEGSLTVNGALTISSGRLNITNCNVTVWSDLNVYGTLKLIGSGYLNVSGNINWFNLSFADINAGNISCGGNWLFDAGCDADLSGSSTMFVSRTGGTIVNRSQTATFGSILIYGLGMAPLYQYQGEAPEDSLRVNGNMVINNINTLNLNGGRAVINGTCTLNLSSSLLFGSGASLLINGDLNQRGKLEIGDAYAAVSGAYTSFDSAITNLYGGTFIHNAAYTGTPIDIRGAITMTAGLIQFSNNSINFKTNSTRVFSGGVLRVGGGLVADEAGSFSQSGGRVELIGNLGGQISMAGNGYFNEVFIEKSGMGALTLNSDIDIHGDFTLQSGYLICNSYNISLHGIWQNYAGSNAFNEGTGTVSFTGNNLITGVSCDETFYNLTLNNSADFFYNFRLLTTKSLSITNDLRLVNGTLNLQTACSLNVGNDIIISNGAGLNAYYGGNSTITVTRNITDSNILTDDAQGLNLGLNTLVFTGSPISNVLLSQPALELGYLTINKSLSSEVRFNKPVKVSMNTLISRGLWYDTSNGFTHEFRGNVTVSNVGNFYPSNRNTLSFKGDSYQVFTYNGTNAIYALTVDKSAGSTLALGSNLIALNGGTVSINSGILNIGQYYYRTTGNVTINNNAKLHISQDGWMELANARALTVYSGGVLELIGASGHNAKLTHQSGNYALNLENGSTISAEYATFEYMDVLGLNLKNGSLVDTEHSLNNCTFRFGKANGTLLTINNNQSFSINNANFPTNIWTGTYNVKKAVDSGVVNFYGAFGDFSGAGFESDPYNRIIWSSAAPDLKIVAVTVSNPNPYLCDTISIAVTIHNDSAIDANTPFSIDLYKNRTVPPGVGEDGDVSLWLGSLDANAQTTVTFTNISSDLAEAWSGFCWVDPDNVQSEALESNNIASVQSINWHPLPQVTNPMIEMLNSSVTITWNYPIPVYRFKIYQDTDPNGSFSTLLGTSLTTSFSETISGSHYFYKITAERLLP